MTEQNRWQYTSTISSVVSLPYRYSALLTITTPSNILTTTMSLLRTYFPAIFIISTTLLILGTSFFQSGYILTLDTIWGPTFPLIWSTDNINNTFIISALLHTLSLIIPTWMVQKIFLFFVISSLLTISWKYTPYTTSISSRAFVALLYTLNPFVYGRILSGQWFHLIGYALLPLLIHSLIIFTSKKEIPKERSATYRLALSLVLISLFSIHFLYLACIITGLWITVYVVRDSMRYKWEDVRHTLTTTLLTGVIFLISCSYWIVPAMMRSTPIEARFDTTYYDAFAAAPHNQIPVMLNVLGLGGFWGEDTAWSLYFIWPQDILLFWIALGIVLILVTIGAVTLLRRRETRLHGALFISLGILAYIATLGTSDTPFRTINLFLYDNVPLWNGLRDSHKVAGVLALIYAILGGAGLDTVISRQARWHKGSMGIFGLFVRVFWLIPAVILGIYMWNGFHGQLPPTDYPKDWYKAKQMIDTLPSGEKVLVLPWHGYLSLPFIHNHIVANPTPLFFGKDRIISGRSIELGPVYDQEVDGEYRKLDELMSNIDSMTENDIVSELHKRHITTILVINNPSIEHSEEGLTYWTDFYDGRKEKTRELTTWKELLPHATFIPSSNHSITIIKL